MKEKEEGREGEGALVSTLPPPSFLSSGRRFFAQVRPATIWHTGRV